MAIQAENEDFGASARLWATVRALTDAERQHVTRTLARFRSLRRADDDDDDNERPMVRVGGHEWTCPAFAETLLAHLRELAHEQSQLKAETSEQPPSEPPVNAFTMHSADFPTLVGGGGTKASPTAEAIRLPVKATKRRITTTLISTDTPYAAVAAKQPTPMLKPILTDSADETAWSKRNLLEKRMVPSLQSTESELSPHEPPGERRRALLMGELSSPALNSASKTPSGTPAVANPWVSPPPTTTDPERRPPPLSLNGKQKAKRAQTLMELKDKSNLLNRLGSSVAENSRVFTEANLQAARIYGHLIGQRLVPSICGEIQFLMGLLYRSSCAHNSVGGDQKCPTESEFCHSHASTEFAAATIELLEPMLIHLGSDMVQLVVKSLKDLKLCENMVTRLRIAMVAREEQRVQESARIGCQLPIETKGTVFRDYALPFCEDMDSRLNYRTPVESVIYSNREKTRDAFLSQLRSFQKKQNSLIGKNVDGNESGATMQDARQLLQDVMSENMWWFARFFVLELVQIGSNPLGESDKDLVMKIMEDKMVVKNPDRLRKLHRRFSSQKITDSTSAGSTAAGFHNYRGKPNHHQSGRQQSGDGGPAIKRDNSKSRQNIGNNSTENKSPPVLENKGGASRSIRDMEGFFSDNQAFFYHFLVSCDSYQFAELVKHQLEGQFLSIWKATTQTDPRKEFTEIVLRLKVLAKFIGFFRFSPQWHWSELNSALSSKNPAIVAAQREAVATLEQFQSANGFDVLELFQESIISNKIAKCIPWLCDYLCMLSSDSLSLSTRYFQRILQLVAFVHRSQCLDWLGETGLYVAMQIERLFHILAFDDVLPRALRWHRIDVKPPSWMEKAVVDALLQDIQISGSHRIDALPFLYSSMFVQVCISELDDLRGFIQTRANPHRRNLFAASRRASPSGIKSLAIRKVRPLQVVNEDQLDSTSLVQGGIGPDRGEEANNLRSENDGDSLREAFFKVYPQLKRAVEFVVDMVVTNMCEHAINKYVKPNADALIDSCVEEAKAKAPAFTQLILHSFQLRLDERLEDFMATTVSTALQEATELCARRVEEALTLLVAPSIPRQIVAAATSIGKMQAAAAITSLIARSLRTEFLKRIAQRKRAIVKEAGAAAAESSSVAVSSHSSDDSDNPDSVARALKFTFDDSKDAGHSPFEEAIQAVSVNVVSMHGVAQTVRTSSTQAKRSVAAFMRFEHAFRQGLSDAIKELAMCDAQIQAQAAMLLWSWGWRALRLSLKLFASRIEMDANPSTKRTVESGHFSEFAASFCETLRVVSELRSAHDETLKALINFAVESALSIPVMVTHRMPSRCVLPEGVLDCSATIYACALTLGGSAPKATEADQLQEHAVAKAIVARASRLPSAA